MVWTHQKSGVYKLTNPIVVEENSKQKLAFNFFPNPSNSIINIETESNIATVNITITDVLGQTVLSKTSTENKTQLNVSHFTKGIYLVTVSDGNKSNTQKLIIN